MVAVFHLRNLLSSVISASGIGLAADSVGCTAAVGGCGSVALGGAAGADFKALDGTAAVGGCGLAALGAAAGAELKAVGGTAAVDGTASGGTAAADMDAPASGTSEEARSALVSTQ